MFTIEDNVPMPEGRASPQKYPWAQLAPSQSFLVPTTDKEEAAKRAASIRTLASNQSKKLNAKFSVRLTENGVRVWRLS